MKASIVLALTAALAAYGSPIAPQAPVSLVYWASISESLR